MRKLYSLLLSCLFYFGATSQDIEKIQKQLEKDMSDTVNFPYGNNQKNGSYYNIRGMKMYVEVYGEGEPLLFIHGNSGSINNFLYQIPYFSKKYKVIVADSRSQGRTEDRQDSLTYEMMADDYAALLEAMQIKSAYVVGWSDGGINSILLALRHPEKVKKMAITGANLVPDTTAVPKEIWNMVKPGYFMLKNKKNKSYQDSMQLKLLRLLIEQPHISTAELQQIKAPTLVIGGDNDVIKPEHTLLIWKNIPGANLWILPNSGHSTPLVYKDDFNRVLDQFFQTPPRKFSANDRFF